MTPQQIKQFISDHTAKKERTLVIVDFGNVEKWKQSLGWDVGIRELGNLAKNFSSKKPLRRFYYGSDYGPKERETQLLSWSKSMISKAQMNGFEVVTKHVKYMPSDTNPRGYDVKCDLDVEMAIDLVRERDNYDSIVVFSGDGDLYCALKYLHDAYGKECCVFGARNHVGREIADAKAEGIVSHLLFAEDFEYRLSYQRRFSY